MIYVDLGEDNKRQYEINRPDGGWRRNFEDEVYVKMLRPIAETLALIDGSAFIGHWSGYLSEADAIYRANGELDDWPNVCSWIKRKTLIESDPVLKDLNDKLEMLLILKEKNESTR
jgi:hypothetical protein